MIRPYRLVPQRQEMKAWLSLFLLMICENLKCRVYGPQVRDSALGVSALFLQKALEVTSQQQELALQCREA
jgi:hypothetical protein